MRCGMQCLRIHSQGKRLIKTNRSASIEMAVISLCYFHAIDVERMGRAKRSAIGFLKGFTQTFKANNVNIVTTMWNRLQNEKITDAEQRCNALQVEIYKVSASITNAAHE